MGSTGPDSFSRLQVHHTGAGPGPSAQTAGSSPEGYLSAKADMPVLRVPCPHCGDSEKQMPDQCPRWLRQGRVELEPGEDCQYKFKAHEHFVCGVCGQEYAGLVGLGP